MSFSSIRTVVALIATLYTSFLSASSISIPLSPTHEVPAVLSLPTDTDYPLTLLTGKPLSHDPQRRKLRDILFEAQSSSEKQISLRIFRDPATGTFEVSNGTNEQNIQLPFFGTYHLVFNEKEIVVTPHIEPHHFSFAPTAPLFCPGASNHHSTQQPFYSPPDYFPLKSPSYPPFSFFPPEPFPFIPSLPLPLFPHPAPGIPPSALIHDLRADMCQLQAHIRKLRAQDTASQSQITTLLEQQKTLLAQIAQLQQQRHSPTPTITPTNLSEVRASISPVDHPSPHEPSADSSALSSSLATLSVSPLSAADPNTSSIPAPVCIIDHRKKKSPSSSSITSLDALATPVIPPSPQQPARPRRSKPSSTPTMPATRNDQQTLDRTEAARKAKEIEEAERKRRQETLQLQEQAEQAAQKERDAERGRQLQEAAEKRKAKEAEEETLRLENLKKEEETKKEHDRQETERARAYKAAQDAEKAAQVALWNSLESACGRNCFEEAFTSLSSLGLRHPLRIKGLITIAKGFKKASSSTELSPQIISALRALFEAKNSQRSFIIQNKDDRRLLVDILLKQSSEEDKEYLLAQASQLGNVVAATHWHILQMKKSSQPCARKGCVHKTAHQFFSTQVNNKELQHYLPYYFAYITTITTCSHSTNPASSLQTLLGQAKNAKLTSQDMETLKLHIPAEYQHVLTPPVAAAASPSKKSATLPLTREKVEQCTSAMHKALADENLLEAKAVAVAFVTSENRPVEEVVKDLSQGLSERLIDQSNVSLQIATLILIETVINTFRNQLPLTQLDALRLLFEKIPLRELSQCTTRPTQCGRELQTHLSHLLNPFFIGIATVRGEFEKARTATKKHLVLKKQLQPLLEQVQTPADAARIMQSLLNFRKDDTQSFCPEVEKFIGEYIDQHPEKKNLWKEFIVNSSLNFEAALKELHQKFEQRKGPIPKVQLIHAELLPLFKKVTCRKGAENFIQSLHSHSENPEDPLSFFHLMITCLRENIRKTEGAETLWEGLLPPPPRRGASLFLPDFISGTCTLL